jgi:hypothetical protein
MRWQIPLVLTGLLAVPAWAQAQIYPSTQYPTSHYPSTQYPTSQYPTLRYPSSSLPASQPRPNPAAAAAQQQSGLSANQVETLLLSKGYTKLNDIRADPNSVWVWQADGLNKDGHPVRIGVDYRGQALVIAPTPNLPCTTPGADFGVSSFGVGARLSATSSCNH